MNPISGRVGSSGKQVDPQHEKFWSNLSWIGQVPLPALGKKWSNAVIHNCPPKVTYIPTPLSWVGCGGSTSFSGVVESREHLRMWLSMHHYTVCSKQKIKKIAWVSWPDLFCFQIRTSFSQKMHRKIVVTKFWNGNKSYRTIGWVAKTKSILIQSYNWKNPRQYASYVTNFNSSCFFWAQSWWCNMKFSQ